MFLSISEGRRKQLKMNRFAGWDLDCELVMGDSVDQVRGKESDCLLTLSFTFQDNYIRPQAVKEELQKKIHQQINGCRKKSNESRNITFATDDKKFLRTKSVNEAS